MEREPEPAAYAAGSRPPGHPLPFEWRPRTLDPGDSVEGRVFRLPRHGHYAGNYLFVRTEREGIVGIPATAAKGHSVLAKHLAERDVKVGDHVRVVFTGWRTTSDGERQYRSYTVVNGGRIGGSA